MITNNRLDKSFGPVGTIAGITIFIVGLILTFYSLSGLFLILIGAFVGFTSTSTLVDNANKRIKFSNNLFGFVQTGRWIEIEPKMKIGIIQSSRTWRAYSRSNRSSDVTDKDFRIILYDENKHQIMPIKKTVSLDLAEVELEVIIKQLGLNPI